MPDNSTTEPSEDLLPASPSPLSSTGCTQRKWYIHLASSLIVFIGGLLIILLVRLMNRLFSRRSGRPNVQQTRQQQQHHRQADNDKDGALLSASTTAGVGIVDGGGSGGIVSSLRFWANELICAQNVTGKLLAIFIFVLSISSAGIYLYEATYLVGFVESCVPWLRNVPSQVDLAFNLVFLAYFCVRFLAAQNKLWFWLELYSIVEYCTVPPAFVAICLNQSWLGLRFMRGLRIMTLPDVLQCVSAVKSGAVVRSLQMITIFLSVWLIGAGVTHLFENSGDPQDNYGNSRPLTIGDCLYFTIVTMSTVGFGDISPKTNWGKFFISIYIMFALGIFASFIPEIAEIITSRSQYAGSYQKEHGRKHVIVCGAVSYDSIESFLGDFLHEDRQETGVEVVCINKMTPNLEFQGLLKRNWGHVVYFTGTVLSPTDCQ